MKKPIWIAIDGPAGSGKSTIASELAKRLNNFIHINTGSMYRAFAYYVKLKNIDVFNEEIRKEIISQIRIFFDDLDVCIEFNNQILNVTSFIHNEEIGKLTSIISSFADVRQKLVYDQQKIILNQNVIMDGRDIGTVVIPNATLKIYLDASIEKRSQRRLKQLNLSVSDNQLEYEKIKNQIQERDYLDKHKSIGALVKADDAIIVNTDELSIEQTCDLIIGLLNQKLK